MRYTSVLETIGRTPLIQLDRMGESLGLRGRLLAKVESFNPGGSVKDRISIAMVETAERVGALRPGGVIVEATSGNTGVGLAMVAAVKGYRIIIAMPETMSVERRMLFAAYGAELVLTPGKLGMAGSIAEAERIAQETGAFLPMQFDNPANPQAHRLTTALEVLADAPALTAFAAGVGTGGTITGVAQVLKEKRPDVRIVGVEPDRSAVLSGGEAGPHGLMGIGAGFVPNVFERELVDEIVRVKEEDAYDMARLAARREGLLVGISSGAALVAAARIAREAEGEIVVLLPDTGERYLSTPLFQEGR